MLLRVENLSKKFEIKVGQKKLIESINGISFELEKGEFLALCGPSGAGKSSILKCIYRTYIPTKGHILYNSYEYGLVPIQKAPDWQMIRLRRKEIGYVSQFFSVIPRVSAMDIVAEPLVRYFGVDEKEARERARWLLRRLGIPSNLLDAYPSTFSGGEQQRVNIARAIIWKPRLLLLDEPTASLDEKSARIVLELLKELKEEEVGMIGIFHNEAHLKAIADKVLEVKKYE
ncbi:ATP-binding cassette domain-containing protein [Thermodesulfobacterium sp. TA1]|uniref:phosphonate C-P lyase system protein PhnL n=1 Tax=Thermodesulfobacterium sp. TA1 TaxID=2234087 RepID=UPI0012326979|nr:ATP-binding cassette domain-containing protein [Thermodesulfobacterium sp. TA1]QER41867.1 ATP-binding cassette domain-containing protein [Thermodesulfobacterium sp. TA1]